MKNLIYIVLAAALLCGCGTVPNTPPAALNCGPKPVEYEARIKSSILTTLRDPMSAMFEFESPVPGWGPKKEQCWIIKTWCNAKNGFGGYTGREPYWFYFRDGNLVGEATPRMVPVNDWNKPNPLTWSW